MTDTPKVDRLDGRSEIALKGSHRGAYAFLVAFSLEKPTGVARRIGEVSGGRIGRYQASIDPSFSPALVDQQSDERLANHRQGSWHRPVALMVGSEPQECLVYKVLGVVAAPMASGKTLEFALRRAKKESLFEGHRSSCVRDAGEGDCGLVAALPNLPTNENCHFESYVTICYTFESRQKFPIEARSRVGFVLCP
jgi:hypothetical protein